MPTVRAPGAVMLVPGKTVQLIGYRTFAKLASEIRTKAGGNDITAHAIRNYAHKDKERGHAYLLPQPVAWGEDRLPLWLPEQVATWLDNRPGPGNW